MTTVEYRNKNDFKTDGFVVCESSRFVATER